MINGHFLLRNGFRKIENLEITIGNFISRPSTLTTITSDAFVLGDDPDGYLTIILSPEGPLAVVGSHNAPPDERESFPIEDTEEEVYRCIENWPRVGPYGSLS